MDPRTGALPGGTRGQWQVAIDVGTSNAVVALRRPDGWVRPVPFDGGQLLSAGVFAAPDGRLLVGKEAERGAANSPAHFEPHPKRRIDDGRVLLGDREYEVAWLLGAVLGRAYSEACRLARTRVPVVVLPCPVSWGQRRRIVLTAAASAARLPRPRLVPEPVAAAAYFVHTRGVSVQQGRCALVYDLGGGTFEATVLRRTATGFEVLATEGLADVGGNDIDAAIVAHLRATVRPDDPAWRQLTQPATPQEFQATRALWDGVRLAKERLSRASSTVVSLPLLGVDVPLGREQFEDLARPILDRTMMVATSALAAARVSATDLAAVFPVDGSSRIPLVATLLHRSFSVAPVSIEEPQLAIALGSLVAASGPPSTPPAGMSHPTPPHGIVTPVSGGPPVSGAPPVIPRPVQPAPIRPAWPPGVRPPYRPG
jgi:molecular chaperone DnaK (HSP70)